MTSRVYVRPAGRLTGPSGDAGASDALIVAGRRDLAFMGIDVAARDAGGEVRRTLMPATAIGGLRSQSPEAHAALDRIIAPRASLAGLSLDRPRLMGVVNVTPDSFSDGAMLPDARAAIEHALRLEAEGAEILDIGGESTRPGSLPVPVDQELRRVLPVIEGLAGKTKARLSIDTRNAEVMRRAAAAGVHLLNDVSALTHDPAGMAVAAETGLPVVLMHARGAPRTMQQDPRYGDVLLDVYDYLEARIEACERAGIPRERLIADPGIGFGKTIAHNLALLAGLALFHGLGVPVLLGASRKSFIGTLCGVSDPKDRMPGSVAAALAGAMHGAQILRVHDVAATRQALTVWEASSSGPAG